MRLMVVSVVYCAYEYHILKQCSKKRLKNDTKAMMEAHFTSLTSALSESSMRLTALPCRPALAVRPILCR